MSEGAQQANRRQCERDLLDRLDRIIALLEKDSGVTEHPTWPPPQHVMKNPQITLIAHKLQGDGLPIEESWRAAQGVIERANGRPIYHHTKKCRDKGCAAGWYEPCDHEGAAENAGLVLDDNGYWVEQKAPVGRSDKGRE
jgi:hypothetical protein